MAPRAWISPPILLWLSNGLGYIYDRSGLTGRCRPQGLSRKRQKDVNMSIEQFIGNEVKSNDVVLFMKGTPQFPQCGFSGHVVQTLHPIRAAYNAFNVLTSATRLPRINP